MELNGTRRFAAPPQAVWDALHDAALLKESIPGAESVAWQGERAVTIAGGMGPIKGSVTADVESQAPGRMRFTVNRAAAQGALTVELAQDGTGTLVTYAGTAEASGPLGAALTLGQGMIKSGVDQFFSNLESKVR